MSIIILTKFLQDILWPSRRCDDEHSELCDRSSNAEGRKIDKKMLK
ncbi:MAG: hypothetical protein GXP08_03525 [Gammaproteobacteria bacterium]|nr:hypothetical protein [Gammaproteobacteria bacterium]